MVRTKKEKPNHEIARMDKKTGWILKYEYQIKPYFEYDEKLNKDFFILELMTFREFASFQYQINYKFSHRARDYDVKILGLDAKDISFPYSGKATAKIRLENMVGKYFFHIIKQNGESNSFELDINPFERRIKLLKEFIREKKKLNKFVEFIG